MINRQQALEIIEKFGFFQGQRAGRELWADKPREVQEDDLIHFQVDCELLKEFIESQPERPKGRWIQEIHTGLIGETNEYNDTYFFRCSICGRTVFEKEPYCHCGADMRDGEEE